MPNMILKPLLHSEEPLTGYQSEQAVFAKMKAEFRQRKRRVRLYLVRRRLRSMTLGTKKTGQPEGRPAEPCGADQRPMQLA